MRTHLVILGLIVTMLGSVGCTRPLLTGTTAIILPETERSKDELPPSEALKACLTAARNLDKAGNEVPAIAQYERVLHLAPDNVEVMHRLAVLYDRQSEFAKADALYLKLTQARPRDANLFNDWGYSYYLRNKWTEAEMQLRRALEIDLGNQRARANLGLVLGQLNRHDDALQLFRDAGLSEAEARCNLAFVYWSQGRLEDARREALVARQTDPGSTRPANLLAQLDKPARPAGEQTTSGPSRGRPPLRAAAPSASSDTTGAQPVYVSPTGMAWYPVDQDAAKKPDAESK